MGMLAGMVAWTVTCEQVDASVFDQVGERLGGEARRTAYVDLSESGRTPGKCMVIEYGENSG